jgi:hypothetical protein
MAKGHHPLQRHAGTVAIKQRNLAAYICFQSGKGFAQDPVVLQWKLHTEVKDPLARFHIKPRQSFGNSSVQEGWQKDRSGLNVLFA